MTISSNPLFSVRAWGHNLVRKYVLFIFYGVTTEMAMGVRRLGEDFIRSVLSKWRLGSLTLWWWKTYVFWVANSWALAVGNSTRLHCTIIRHRIDVDWSTLVLADIVVVAISKVPFLWCRVCLNYLLVISPRYGCCLWSHLLWRARFF